jgi:hypothetical protein
MSNFTTGNFEQDYFKREYYDKHAWLNTPSMGDQLFVFTKLYIGEDEEMGRKAFSDFLVTISESHPLPKGLVFWNRAVLACVEKSETLGIILKLEEQGVNILVSDSALLSLKIKNTLRTGKPTSYFELLEAISKAQKIITF